LRKTKLNSVVVNFAHTFNVIGKLQAIKVGIVIAVNVMPRIITVKNALKGKHYVIGIQITCWNKPVSFLKRDITAQMKAVSCTVIQYIPTFGQLRHQSISIGIYIQQTVIKLSCEGINNQPATRF